MDKNVIEPLTTAYKVLNPGCVVLVSCGDGDRDNLFAVTWNMPVRKNPPLLALLSGKSHFSYPIIEHTGELGFNVMDASHASAVLGCGRTSGKTEQDKFARFGLTRQAPSAISAPLVDEAIATLECRVERIVDLEISALIIARIVAASADPRHFVDGSWNFDNGLRLLHHLTGSRFCTSEGEISGS